MQLPTMALVVMYLAGLVAMIFFLGILQNALKKCAPASRTMKPGTVWLTLIPLFGQVWQFFVVVNVARSLRNEFARTGVRCPDPDMGQEIGLGMCVCNCGALLLQPIPLFKDVIGVIGFVLWVAYWFRIANFSRALGARPAVAVAPPIG